MNDVSSGTVMTLVIPLSLLVVVLASWGWTYRNTFRRRRGDHEDA